MEAQIKAMLRAGTNFAGVEYTTKVQTAAAHKALDVQKQVVANVQLFASIKDARNVFEAAVKRSASKLDNDADAVANFEAQSNYYTHDDDCYSIVQHKQNGRKYLYAIFNNVSSVVYTIDGAVATKQQVAELLTASARAKFESNDSTVVNKAHGIEHDVQVRTIALDNVKKVVANKQVAA